MFLVPLLILVHTLHVHQVRKKIYGKAVMGRCRVQLAASAQRVKSHVDTRPVFLDAHTHPSILLEEKSATGGGRTLPSMAPCFCHLASSGVQRDIS
jgi:hypothetical protein